MPTGDIVLSQSNVKGNVTFIAGAKVIINGSNSDLTAFSKGVLALAGQAGSGALVVSGSGGVWKGALVAHDGEAEVSGSNSFEVEGSIIARRVKLNGSNWSIDPDGAAAAAPALSLVE